MLMFSVHRHNTDNNRNGLLHGCMVVTDSGTDMRIGM